MVTEKPEKQEKKTAKPETKPKQEKERVKHLIEEKMEKIRQQELVKAAEGKEEVKAQASEEKIAKVPAAGTEEGRRQESPSGKQSPKPAKAKPLPTSAFVTGKRKRAIARAFLKPGKGSVKVNSIPIDLVMPDMYRLKMLEPLMLMGEHWKKFDIRVTVRGGGPAGQADAVRQVIARSLSEVMGPEARKTFLSYDRNLIVYDPRRTETHKPPHSSWGARRYKQKSKR